MMLFANGLSSVILLSLFAVGSIPSRADETYTGDPAKAVKLFKKKVAGFYKERGEAQGDFLVEEEIGRFAQECNHEKAARELLAITRRPRPNGASYRRGHTLPIRKAAISGLRYQTNAKPRTIIKGLAGVIKNKEEDKYVLRLVGETLGALKPKGCVPVLVFLFDSKTIKPRKRSAGKKGSAGSDARTGQIRGGKGGGGGGSYIRTPQIDAILFAVSQIVEGEDGSWNNGTLRFATPEALEAWVDDRGPDGYKAWLSRRE